MRDVTWVRKGKTILNDINWDVKKGEHWSVLGLNGSGKTTLLNMVNGYIWPTTGKVSVLGNPFGKTNIVELRKSIGWVSSSLQEKIAGNQRVQQIVVSGKFASIGLYEEPEDEDYERAKELLEMLGGSHLYDRLYTTCSTGEKQKILIARALMAEPELVILDEPTNGLDFISREELMTSINQMASHPAAPTIILVTHHIEEVLPMFSHTLLLKKGEVYGRGTREEMFTSEKLTDFFEIPVDITWQNERAWMNVKNADV